MGIKFRFTVFFFALTSLLIGGFSSVIYFKVKSEYLKQAKQSLISILDHEWEHIDLPAHQAKAKRGTPHFKDVYLRIAKEGIVVFDSFPHELEEAPSEGFDKGQNKIFHSIQRVHNAHHYELTGFYDLSAIFSYLALLKHVLILGCLSAGLLIIALGLVSTKFLLTPFRRLSQATSEVSADKLSFRFEQPKVLDEFGILVRNFNSLLNRLEKSFSQTRRFAMNASHEIRTPLAAMIAQAEMIQPHLKTVPNAQAAINRILVHGKRLRDIVNRLLFLAEIDRIQQEGKAQPIRVGDAIEEIADTLRSSNQGMDRKIEVTCEDGKRDESFFFSQEIFSCILGNLLENAFKYSSHEVSVSYSKKDGKLSLRIDDDGPGIPKESRGQALEPFVRLQNSSSAPVGHGLGLSIVKACVQSVKGVIELGTSKLGGLSVNVVLPSTVGHFS